MSTLYDVPAPRMKSGGRGMRSQSASSEIDQEDADGDGGGAHDPEGLIGDRREPEEVCLDFVRKCKMGEAFEDEDHAQYAEKIFHRPTESPFFEFAAS